MKSLSLILFPLLWLAQVLVVAQTAVPFDSDQWEYTGDHELTTYEGQAALWLKSSRAFLPAVSFENGVIEYDVAFDDKRGFVGVLFRMQDPENGEDFYQRAHQSGNPDAVQYTPICNGVSCWQLYHGPGYSVATPHRFNEWMHVRLLVYGEQMEVYVDDMDTPILQVPALKRTPEAGFLGLWTLIKGAYFANFSYQALDQVDFASPMAPLPPPEAGTVPNWSVSPAFAEESLNDLRALPATGPEGLNWQKVSSEPTGTANLARAGKKTAAQQSVWAQFQVESSSDQLKALHIGYSDRARIYLNGQLLYAGQREFRSRDYRYLGTIGYFDTLYLPLKAGQNVITCAVSETMGGWGIRARFEDMEGLQW